jgi:hypothetical protein
MFQTRNRWSGIAFCWKSLLENQDNNGLGHIRTNIPQKSTPAPNAKASQFTTLIWEINTIPIRARAAPATLRALPWTEDPVIPICFIKMLYFSGGSNIAAIPAMRNVSETIAKAVVINLSVIRVPNQAGGPHLTFPFQKTFGCPTYARLFRAYVGAHSSEIANNRGSLAARRSAVHCDSISTMPISAVA